MKTVLILLFLASIGINALLLVGCVSAHAKLLHPGTGLQSEEANRISRSLAPDGGESELKSAFDREHSHFEAVAGKIVIVLPDTEEIRNAKRILLSIDK